MDTTTALSLSVPRVRSRRLLVGSHSGDSFGTWSESFARYMGTSRFLLQMSAFILLWLGWNAFAPSALQFDPYTFTFLTLLLSLQASYAAPLILLAQNRQDDRDRSAAKMDRAQAAMGTEVSSHIARELSDVRNRLNDISQELSAQRPPSRKEQSKDIQKRLDRIEATLAKLVDQTAAQVQ
jgi:uncharacterized membrane protein